MHLDAFDFFRWVLGIIATVYATVVTAQSLWGWYVWLAGSDKYISMVRRYVIVQGLRLRFRAFWGDVLVCVLLCTAFVMLWRAHVLIYDLGGKLRSSDFQPPRTAGQVKREDVKREGISNVLRWTLDPDGGSRET